jgi:hypothetical protein
MDHSEAVEKQAPERYLLNEMAIEDREAFEEHFFDCPECAADLRAESALIAGVRLRKARRQPQRWAFWSSSVAAALLAVVVGYQNVVVIPRLAQQRPSPLQPGVLNILAFQVGEARGEEKTASAKTNLALAVDIDTQDGATGYLLEVVDTHGVKYIRYLASPAQAKDAVTLQPRDGRLPPGHYSVNVKAEPGDRPVSSQSFVVQ